MKGDDAGLAGESGADAVALAMKHVLQAEHEGASRVAECQRSAADRLQAARVRAEAISRRADARIARLHAAYTARIMKQVQQVSDPGAPAHGGSESDMGSIAHAIERLAVAITS
ncbi:MAG: hypothetical protein F9K29_22225 [Hyphomicrobiaceae bacterium]|nr:MAG: hypothetical protein F9K29_22225 [Hyphomicrobiaceae bacterium]